MHGITLLSIRVGFEHNDERISRLSKGGSYKTRSISYHKLCLIVYRVMILTFFDLVDYMFSTNLFPEFHPVSD